MRKLTKQEITDLLYGCTILGTGGGGDVSVGLEIMEKDLQEGRELYLADLSDVPEDAYVAVPYMCGSPASIGGEDPTHPDLPVIDEPESLLAFRTIEEYFGQKFFAGMATELGGGNTAFALHACCQLGIPVVDGDPVGRSVPALQHSTFYIKKIPMTPMALATRFGDTMIIKDIVDDLRAEEIVRSIAVASGNSVGVADHPVQGKVLKDSVIAGSLSYALKLGEVLRQARESGDKSAVKIAETVAEAGAGRVLFHGYVSSWEVEDRGGYIYGETEIQGTDEYKDHSYKIWYQNENIVSWLDGKVDVTAPDLICMLDGNGMPVTNPDFCDGMELCILAFPAPELWKSPEGVEILGPRSFGFDFDYVPFEK